MWVTLDQLRIFVAVAERQHVTRVAEALNLAQSAANAAIASLENRHGTKLRRGVVPCTHNGTPDYALSMIALCPISI